METQPLQEYKEGLTWRSSMALLYASIVFLPAVIWVQLATGQILSGAVQYTIILLFVEMARIYGKPLTKQEVYIIWQCAATAGGEAVAVSFLYNLYFRGSPLSMMFTLQTGERLVNVIPSWFAPPLIPEIYVSRSFMNPSWIMPILVFQVTNVLLFLICDVCIALIIFRLYAYEEKLDFPMQIVATEICSTLTERSPSKMRIILISALVSIAFSIFLYGIPFATSFSLVFIPVPWIDFTKSVEIILPGASFGVSTDPIILALGFLLPFPVAISMFVGATIVNLIGNPMLVSMFPPAEGRLGGLFGWSPGMSMQTIWQRSIMYFWASIFIGVGMAGGLMPLIRHPRYITSAFSALRRIPRSMKVTGFLPLPLLLLGYIGGALGAVLITHLLVPDFPLWILLVLTVGWRFVGALISGRALGDTGLMVNVPYVSQMSILASNYQKADIWFAPSVRFTGSMGGGTWVLASLKVAELTETKMTSWIKANFLACFLGWIFSFLYVQMFWSVAPIPSAAYPGTNIFWPVDLTMESLWITKSIYVFRPETILASFLIGGAAALGFSFTKIPFSVISAFAGMASPLASSVTILIGAILAKVLARILAGRLGEGWWKDNRYAIVAGLSLGEGLIVSIGAAIGIIGKSMWILPY